MCNSKRFVVTVHPTSSSPEDPIPRLLSQCSKRIQNDDDEEKAWKAQEEIEDIIYEAGWRKFGPLAPGIEKGPSVPPISLHSSANPETFYFHLVMDGKNADVVQDDPPPSNNGPSHLIMGDASNLPRFSAREILFVKKLMGTGYIAKVSVNGQEMCCKMSLPSSNKAVQREYECLKKIADSNNASSIRAPRLFGLIVGDEGVDGILEEYIPHTMTLDGSPGDIKAVAAERRRKWAEQAKRNMELLHGINVIWGDGKPQNVFINSETDNCCLVDFGGSWTNRWGDAELRETKAGDEQALRRIVDFLGV